MKLKSLSNLEQRVMDIVWEFKKCSTRDVLNKINKDKKYAYTTIATLLNRLNEKGLVIKKIEKEGYVYSPKVSRESYTKNVAQTFLKRFINSFGDSAIASFAESVDKLPQKKKKYFLKILEEHDKNK
ncbi:MAG: BlaI/MecI/CopY family transcriptional regulator [Candidatus Levybacteria bacterium]|nr:BlaI/MecI/CopY family transcriptional regulator [Candidatus Levybacteria bacterium]